MMSCPVIINMGVADSLRAIILCIGSTSRRLVFCKLGIVPCSELTGHDHKAYNTTGVIQHQPW